MMGPGEANYFRDYKRLGPIAKLATSCIAVPAIGQVMAWIVDIRRIKHDDVEAVGTIRERLEIRGQE